MKKYYIVVTPFFPTQESFRGPFIYDQVKALKKVSDYEVVVFKPTTSHDKRAFYEYDGIKVFLFKTRQTPSYIFNGLFNGYNSRSFVKSLRNSGIDIDLISAVHCHTAPMGACGIELKKSNHKIKVLLQHHDKDPFMVLNGRLANWKPNSLYRAKKNIEIFNNVDVHVCISNACRENLLAFPSASNKEQYRSYLSKLDNLLSLSPITPRQTVILYNGVDISKFYNQDKRDPDGFTIGCIANFIPLKGQQDLIKAVADFLRRSHVENVSLKFIGSGPTKENCQHLCTELGIENRVEFLEEVHHEKLIAFYNTLDLFVLPSYFDGFGCVCLEAYACGVPFMISKNQGACEYFERKEEDDWSFYAGDYNRLSELIERYYYKRNPQKVLYTIDINMLVADFLKDVGL